MQDTMQAARRREEGWAYLMLAPYLLMFVVFLIYPSVQGLYLSFTDAQLGSREIAWIGLEAVWHVTADHEKEDR